MIVELIQKNRWCLYCLFFLSGCFTDTQYYKIYSNDTLAYNRQQIDSAKFLIQNGDLITRTGNDFTSESLRKLNQRDRTYSHGGLALIENKEVYIYHAIGGDFNPDQALKREPLEVFLNPSANRCFGIFRFETDSLLQENLKNTIRYFYLSKLPYDMDFNLYTDEKMYCSEFVAKSLEIASKGQIIIPHSFLKEREFIGTDDLFLHPLCKKITSAVFK